MEQWEDKIKRIVMAGIGAIAGTVEKSRDAIVKFAGSEQAKNLADKGEKAVQSVVDAGEKAFEKVKGAISEADLKERVRRETQRLKSLAAQLHELSGEQREVVDAMVQELKNKSTQEQTSQPEAGSREDEDAANEEPQEGEQAER